MSVARPYARALHGAAEQAGDVEGVLGDLLAITEVLEREPELAGFLNHPAVAEQPKRAVLEQAFASRVRPLTMHLLLLLLDKRRLPALPEIARAYRGIVEEAAGRGRGRVESARPLGAAELAALEDVVSRWAGRRVQLAPDVRPELLGGARVVLGDRVIDGSMAAQLRGLRRSLQG